MLKMGAHEKMKRIMIVLAVLTACMLAGCTQDNGTVDDKNGFKIYRTNSGRDTLIWEIVSDKTDYSIDEALEALAAEPADKTMFKLIPDGVAAQQWYFGPDGQLVLDFNSLYTNMDPVAELMCRAGIVKTLCQIENVEYVEFLVEGTQLTLQGGAVVRQMAAQDFIDNTGADAKFAQSVNVAVYFADFTGSMMTESLLRVEYDGLRPLEEIVLYELIEGPLESQTHLFPIMPEGTQVNKVSSRDGICYVDFNGSFLDGREGIKSDVIIYGIVNSLVDISYINKVQITVDGIQLKNYEDTVISGYLGRRPELITNEKAGDTAE